jgi:hypothetical protein
MDNSMLFIRHKDGLEDFWGRRRHGPKFERLFHVCGRPVVMTANQPRILAAVDFVAPLYSTAEPLDIPPFHIDLVVSDSVSSPENPPDNLVDKIEYVGHGSWAMIDLAGWGYCYIDLDAKRALAVVKPGLAEQPTLLGRYLLNTILTNFIISSGFGMLHATALLRQGHLYLLMAPHNSGKSTTALHLVLAGYDLVSDSMIYICKEEEKQRIFAFPVGRVKLRPDMLDSFPEMKSFLERERVRGELKYAVNLRAYNPALVHTESFLPDRVTLFLLSRSRKQRTVTISADSDQVWNAVMKNSLFYDGEAVWTHNMAQIESLLQAANCFHLSVGTDRASLLSAVS